MADRKQKLLAQAACDFSRFLGGMAAANGDAKCNGSAVKPSAEAGQASPLPASAVPLSIMTDAATAEVAHGSHVDGFGSRTSAGGESAALSPTAPSGRAVGAATCDSSLGFARADAAAAVLANGCSAPSTRASAISGDAPTCHDEGRSGSISSDGSSKCSSAESSMRSAASEPAAPTEEGVATCKGELAARLAASAAAASSVPSGGDAAAPPHESGEAVLQLRTPTAPCPAVARDSDDGAAADESDVVMLSCSPSGVDATDGAGCAGLPKATGDCLPVKKVVVGADSDDDESGGSTTGEEEGEDSSSLSDANMSDGASELQEKESSAQLTVDQGLTVRPSLAQVTSSGCDAAVITASAAVSEAKNAALQQQHLPAMTEWRQGKASPEESDVDDEPAFNALQPNSDSDTDSLDEMPSAERKGDRPPKTKGELTVEDLPPLKELHISVPETVAVKEVGTVSAIVDTLVIIQSRRELSALDIDTILFLEGRKSLGKIFEVFGPVPAPLYSVRFNSTAEITAKAIAIGLTVYYAPSEKKLTRYVFVERLQTAKGSDASWKDNNEPPAEVIDYSDDEKERQAKSHRRRRGRLHDETDDAPAAHERPAVAEESAGTADAGTHSHDHSRSRRGRGRGGRARPFSVPRHQSRESFIVPGANAAQWGGGGTHTGHGTSPHDWSRPPPPLPTQPGQQHPPLPGQGQHWYAAGAPGAAPAAWYPQQYQQPLPSAWQQPPPAAPHRSLPAAAWPPQIKQEPSCEWSTLERQAAWSQQHQQSAWPAAQGHQWHQPPPSPAAANGDAPASAVKAGKKRTAQAAAAAVATVQPATARLSFIIDTRYVQSSQQPNDDGGNEASSAEAKPCSNWPDYDD